MYKHECIDCFTVKRIGLHQDIVDKLVAKGKLMNISLRAERPDDVVHGYINIVGDEVSVHLYNIDEDANKEHKSKIVSHRLTKSLINKLKEDS